MGFIKEFKEFAIKGNLVDMAVGVVMGAAFGKIVSAFIDGMVMPLVGMMTSGQDFTKLAYTLQAEVKGADGAVTSPLIAIKYGTFITEVINFLVVAFVVFMVIKAINKMKKAEAAAAPPAPPASEVLLGEIRDLLKK